jgi:pimeloyl-ACP methyl ester carboxylesterase
MPSWNAPNIDGARWITGCATPSWVDEVTIHYIHCRPISDAKGVILLIHGFPRRRTNSGMLSLRSMTPGTARLPLTTYRGAGHSSHTREEYSKSIMAADLHTLLVEQLHITESVHIMGHNIGGICLCLC